MKSVKNLSVIIFLTVYTTVSAGPNGAKYVAPNPLNSIPNSIEQYNAIAAQKKLQKDRDDKINAFIPDDPWRFFQGETNYVKRSGIEFCGRVIEVQPNGIRVKGNFGNLFESFYFSNIEYEDRNREFFIANFPYQCVEDQVLPENRHYMAYEAGTYTYTTVQGASRTILKLDYGTPCDPPAELIRAQQEQLRQKAERDRQAAMTGKLKAVEWLKQQSTNGSASAQCSLGLHYLKGDGCETNRPLGVYWLTQAANQGNVEASNKLAEISATSAAGMAKSMP